MYVGEIDTYEDLIQARNCCHLYSQNGFIDSSDLHTIIIDFDGVLTDNKVTTSSDGKELIQTSKYDSLALSLLKKHYSIFILTSEKSTTHMHRSKKLGIELVVANNSKNSYIQEYLVENNLKRGSQHKPSVIYVGNDLMI